MAKENPNTSKYWGRFVGPETGSKSAP